jgi:hypothetical protein
MIFIFVALSVSDSSSEDRKRVFEPSNPPGTKKYYQEPLETKEKAANTVIDHDEPNVIDGEVESTPSGARSETKGLVARHRSSEPIECTHPDEQSESFRPIMWKNIKEPSRQTTATSTKTWIQPLPTTKETTIQKPIEPIFPNTKAGRSNPGQPLEKADKELPIVHSISEEPIDHTKPNKPIRKAAPLDSDSHKVGVREFGSRSVEGVSGAYHSSPWESVMEFLHEHLEVGLRFTSFELDETPRPEDPFRQQTFLGFVNQLEEEQDSAPKFYMNILINKYVGFEITHDAVAARTRNFNNGQSDGILEMSGPIYSIIGRYPFEDVPIFGSANDYRVDIIPFLGLGYADWEADFKEEGWWAAGFSSPESWASAGSPSPSESGMVRMIQVSDDSSTVIMIGLALSLHEHFGIDIIYRQMELSTDAQFLRGSLSNPEPQSAGEFPMDHSTLGFGAKFIF